MSVFNVWKKLWADRGGWLQVEGMDQKVIVRLDIHGLETTLTCNVETAREWAAALTEAAALAERTADEKGQDPT